MDTSVIGLLRDVPEETRGHNLDPCAETLP